ncbi:hypothetical protein EC991_001773 [Linnemannia zychae]|nr:hypothetical protein EC991_001773 [Linnemannia zychae]
MSTTSVVFIGNPGVGKSALLNSLGGSFPSGISEIGGLTKTVSSQNVVCNWRSLRLIDVPGIMETGSGGTISGNLRMLEETLNNSGEAVLFFVITPRNGRIGPDDFAVMKTLLNHLERSPTVGVILTQVRPYQVKQLQSHDYYNKIKQYLAETGVNTHFIEKNRFVVLGEHDEDFSSAEVEAIRNYVLSFNPVKVKSKSLIGRVFTAILDFFRSWFR